MFYTPQSLSFHAWLSPTGELFRVDYWEHEDWAYDYLKKDSIQLEKEGWLKISDSHIVNPNFRFNELQKIKMESLGFVIEEFCDRGVVKQCYHIPEDDYWFDNIPYAKGTQRWKNE